MQGRVGGFDPSLDPAMQLPCCRKPRPTIQKKHQATSPIRLACRPRSDLTRPARCHPWQRLLSSSPLQDLPFHDQVVVHARRGGVAGQARADVKPDDAARLDLALGGV